MSTNLVVLAVLMFAVTYPSRALGLLTPDRLPKAASRLTCNWSPPAVLAALAAVSVMVVVGNDDVPSFHVGIEWVAVLGPARDQCRPCWRNLSLAQSSAAVAIVVIARAAGLAALPG